MLRDRIRANPVWFINHVLGAGLWGMQQGIVEAVAQHDHVCVPSCHASGKDYTTARLVLWFLHAHKPCTVLTTGPTDRQVKEILWREITTAHKTARFALGGRLLQQKLELDHEHFALGFTSSDTDSTAGQGFHNKHIFIVIDESAGVTRDVRDSIEGNLSAGETVKLLEIGNPTDPTSPFAAECARSGTLTYGIDAFSTPNFTAFGLKPKDFDNGDWTRKIDGRSLPATYLISPSWVFRQVDRYGWDDPFVVARVRGQFPGAGPDSLLKREWIDAAQENSFRPSASDPLILSCDVARFGDDETIIGYKKGVRYRRLQRNRGNDTMETAGRLLDLDRAMKGAAQIRVDDDGVGGGVVDRLREELGSRSDIVIRMMGGSGATEEDPEDGPRFYNARAEWHWGLKLAFKHEQIDIDDGDDELERQLGQLKIKRYDGKGRIIIEDKADYKKRVGRSPDDADTCLYANAELDVYPDVQVF